MKQGTVWLVLVIAWTVIPATGQAQDHPADDDVRELIRAMNERINALERTHNEDKEKIQELEQHLARVEGKLAEQAAANQQQPTGEGTEPVANEPAASSGLFDLSMSGFGATNELNPQTTIFFDAGGSVSSRGRNKALNRFNLREVEADFRAAISPSADGVIILTLEEDITQDHTGDISTDRNVDIEESYINFHSLPHDLSLKFGKFRNVFGVNNVLHTHDLPQVDRPFVIQSILGPEGLLTTGASLSWLVPNPWDKYIETTVQVVNADGGEESPILGGPNADNPAVVGHVKFFDDLTETSSWELGGSYLFGSTSRNSDFDAHVFGVDLTYHWIDPDPSTFHSLVLQSELLWADNDIDRGLLLSRRNTSFGAYLFGQYQLNRDWYTGLRADFTEFPNSESRGPADSDYAVSPYLTWYVSEFLRARLEYQHRWINRYRGIGDEDVVFLQVTGVIGAHPPHPYWVNR